jgi:hypothetical protein
MTGPKSGRSNKSNCKQRNWSSLKNLTIEPVKTGVSKNNDYTIKIQLYAIGGPLASPQTTSPEGGFGAPGRSASSGSWSFLRNRDQESVKSPVC